VDDEPINLRLMRDVFNVVLKRPDQIVTVLSAEEAISLLAGQAVPFDLIISDQRMPGMSGTDLLARAREMAPASARMILTGFPSDKEVQQALRAGVAQAILAKPWRPRDLEGAIEEALSRTAN
jgi:CheY-like chemotaxis protein